MKDEPTSENQGENLTPADQRLIEVIRTELDQGERSPAQRAAFRAQLEGRIEARSAPFWKPFGIAATVAMAAFALWLVQPNAQNDLVPNPGDAVVLETASVGLLAYAYYETDYLGSTETETDFLPDEFQAIANAFDVP